MGEKAQKVVSRGVRTNINRFVRNLTNRKIINLILSKFPIGSRAAVLAEKFRRSKLHGVRTVKRKER